MSKATYQRLIQEDKSTNPAYSLFIDALSNIMELQTAILANPKLANSTTNTGKKAFEALNKNYMQLNKLGETLLESNTDFVKNRAHIIKNIMKSANYDRSIISEAVATGKDPQAVHHSKRTTVLDISGANIKTVGANSSQRIPVVTASGEKGFFTPNSSRSHRKTRENILKGYKDKLPANVYKAFERFALEEDWQLAESMHNIVNSKNAPFFQYGKYQEDAVASAIDAAQLPSSVKKAVRSNDQLLSTVGELFTSLSKQHFVESFRKNWHIEDGRNVANRNIAMSEIADMMGCGSLLARSKPMTLIKDGKAVEGVFMENVEGKDINSLPINDIMYELTIDDLNSPQLLHQIADLQILDIVCGNVDRHSGNMIYDMQVVDGKPKIVGIKGIDNDGAFVASHNTQAYMTPYNLIGHISRNMYDFLNTPNCGEKVKNMLLMNGYTREEANCAELRIVKLKQAIKKNDVKVVEKDEWKNYNIRNLSYRNKNNSFYANLFYRTAVSLGTLSKTTAEDKIKYRYKEINFVQGKKAGKAAIESDMLAKFIKHGSKMDEIDQLRKPSDEFKAMRDQLKEIESLAMNKINSGKALTEEEKQTLAEKTTQLVEKCNTYITLKSLVPKTSTGKQRQQYAYRLMGFAEKMLNNDFNLNIEEESLAEDKEVLKNTVQEAAVPSAAENKVTEATAESKENPESKEGVIPDEKGNTIPENNNDFLNKEEDKGMEV